MRGYHHLTQDQRYQIWSLKKTGMIQEEIAKEIGVDPNGNAVAVWYQYDGTRNNIWANRYLLN